MTGPYAVYPPFGARQASQTTGFAQGASESEYPGLWKGLIGLWCSPVGPDGFTRVTDYSAVRNNGTLNNYAGRSQLYPWVVGRYQNAVSLSFDGTNDFVNVPTNTIYDTAEGSYSLWFRARNQPSGNGGVLITRNTGSDSGNWLVLSGGTLQYQAHDGGSVEVVSITSTTSIQVGVWYHACATWSQASGGSNQLYLNGLLNAPAANNSGAWQNSGNPVRLADSLDTFWSIFDGWMDTVCFYNRKLTAEEINQIYTKNASPQTPKQPKVIFLPVPTPAAVSSYDHLLLLGCT